MDQRHVSKFKARMPMRLNPRSEQLNSSTFATPSSKIQHFCVAENSSYVFEFTFRCISLRFLMLQLPAKKIKITWLAEVIRHLRS
ncbi:MAG: hypothetical protein COB78_00040 [Hyphomicrobiales bacterium]|nr:MAG: hypothetical protein COB78_00040 [Hyphomicrobiales bacterium]